MRIRFTIHDLLWLAVVVALAMGWWLQSCDLKRQLEAANAEIKQIGLKDIWGGTDVERLRLRKMQLEEEHEAALKELELLRALQPPAVR